MQEIKNEYSKIIINEIEKNRNKNWMIEKHTSTNPFSVTFSIRKIIDEAHGAFCWSLILSFMLEFLREESETEKREKEKGIEEKKNTKSIEEIILVKTNDMGSHPLCDKILTLIIMKIIKQ